MISTILLSIYSYINTFVRLPQRDEVITGVNVGAVKGNMCRVIFRVIESRVLSVEFMGIKFCVESFYGSKQ